MSITPEQAAFAARCGRCEEIKVGMIGRRAQANEVWTYQVCARCDFSPVLAEDVYMHVCVGKLMALWQWSPARREHVCLEEDE